MQNKRMKMVFWLSVACLFTAVVLSCLYFGNKKKNDKLVMAEVAIANALSKDFSSINNSELTPEFFSSLLEKIDYEILGIEEKDGVTVAQITVKSIDLYSLAQKLDETYINVSSTEEMDRVITEELRNTDILETEIEVVLLEGPDGYSAILTEDFYNAYYGNITKLQQEYLSSLWKGLE